MPGSYAASTWTVPANGESRRGELIIARAWEPVFDAPVASPDLSFRLVLLTEPSPRMPDPLTNPRVLCVAADGAVYSSVPSTDRSVRETQALYGAAMQVGEALLPLDKVQQFLAIGSEYLTTHGYVQAAELPLGQDELEVDRKSLLAQLEPAYLLDHPEVWPGVVASFSWFRARYLALYWRFHEAYQGEVLQAAALLQQARERAEALHRLNTLSQLGPPVGVDALQAWEARLQHSTRCFFDEGMPEREPVPYCPQCGLRIDAPSPKAAAQSTVAAIDGTLNMQLKRLSSQAVRRVLGDARPRLARFLDVLQASDASTLVQVLDDDLTAFLQALLAEELPPLTATPVLARLREQYEVVEEDQVGEAVQAFERLLKEAVERAHHEHPQQPARLRLE